MWRSSKNKEALYSATGKEIICLDTETTGFSADKCSIIQFSAIKILLNPDGSLVEKESIDLYINPGCSLPPKIIELTGITDEMLVEAPYEDEAYRKIIKFMGTSPIVCGHNIMFDVRFVSAMYSRNGKEFKPEIILDTLEMSRDLVGSSITTDYKLATIAKLYGVDDDITFHSAIYDARVCARLLPVFLLEYKEADAKACSVNSGPKKKPYIVNMHYWPGYRGRARIYMHTDIGAFFYDIMTKTWDKKSDNPCDLSEVDMEFLKASALKKANATDEREFARFRG